MANNDNLPSYGEGYNEGYEDAKAEAAEVLRDFISYEMEIIKEFSRENSYQNSDLLKGMGFVLNALLVTCKSHCIFDEVVDDD